MMRRVWLPLAGLLALQGGILGYAACLFAG